MQDWLAESEGGEGGARNQRKKKSEIVVLESKKKKKWVREEKNDFWGELRTDPYKVEWAWM